MLKQSKTTGGSGYGGKACKDGRDQSEASHTRGATGQARGISKTPQSISLNTRSNRLEASLRDRYDVLAQQIQLMRDQVNALSNTPLSLATAAQKQKEQRVDVRQYYPKTRGALLGNQD